MPTVVVLACLLAAPVRVAPGPAPAGVVVVARLPGPGPDGTLTPREGERLLRFALVPDGQGAAGPAMLGTYERRGGTLTFTPRFRLAAGARYRATLTTAAGAFDAGYRVPADPPAKPAVVQAVYPTDDALPANLLKFYLHFSKPMREGPAVFDRIKLVRGDGEVVEDPWRRTELWNEDATRLTLWVHPGRIKEGVNLRDEIGPVLEPGRRYTLVVGGDLPDATGRPLAAAFRKTFRTTEPVRVAVEVTDWTLAAPKSGTREPLDVRFPRPLDHALLGRSPAVRNGAGEPVAGRVVVGPRERSWAFRPDRPWEAGTYTLTVHAGLEDLAGNTILRPFDLDLKAPAAADPPRTLRFRVGP